MKKGPQVIGEMFRESLDLGYVAHNDTYKRHRALRLAQADHRFSGTYQCKVSSFLDEDFQQKEVLVYSEYLHVMCEQCTSSLWPNTDQRTKLEMIVIFLASPALQHPDSARAPGGHPL